MMTGANLLTAISAIALFSTGVPVFAGEATLAAPARTARLATDAGGWACDGVRCAGPAQGATGELVAVCTAVADNAGRVTAFTAGDKAFAEAELARCNRHAK